MEQKARDWFSDHKLLFAFGLVLLVCGLIFGASLQFSAALLLVSILPGYLLSKALTDLTDVERVVTAAPLSMVFVAVATLVPNILFDLKTVDGLYVIFLDLLLLGWLVFKGSKKTLLEPIMPQAIVLGLTVLGFFVATFLVAYGSLNHPANDMVWSIDAVLQYNQVSWMAARHDNSVPPSFNPRWRELSGANVVPTSVVSQAVITQLSGTAYWNANAYFLVIVFISMVLGAFLLFRRIIGIEAGLVAAFAVALPFQINYAYPFYFGLWREIFSLMLTAIVIYYCLKTIDTRGKYAPVLGALLLLFGLTHIVTAWGIAASVILVLLYSLLEKEAFKAVWKPFLVRLAEKPTAEGRG